MDFSNDGASIYHRVLARYLRQGSDLVRYVGQSQPWMDSAWPLIHPKVVEASRYTSDTTSEPVNISLVLNDTSSGVENIDIYEIPNDGGRTAAGLILQAADKKSSEAASSFERLFAKLILNQVWMIPYNPPLSPSTKEESTTHEIVDLFDRYLRYAIENDKWESQGRQYFTAKVQYYVHHNLQLELCLPAFPCKSSNPEKVMGIEPDKGEEMALRRLHGFVEKVDEIYSPGARLWIISDGHVFSDCIGVDDQIVDSYGSKLKNLNESICSASDTAGRIDFKSLVDIFDLRAHGLSKSSSAEAFRIPKIDHHIATAMTEEAEICRQILMAGCQPSRKALRAQIQSQDTSILSLYRGFSRFMLEDLDLHPLTKPLSRSQRKKLATNVSFEMILRNQAYSNLVELIFPDHIRLSIHAHNNSGPKFGIQLFDKNAARASSTLAPDDRAKGSQDLLHIPTPWHNCIVEVEGDPVVHVMKSAVAKEALANKEYSGGWIEGILEKGQGGAFSLIKSPVQNADDDAERAKVVEDKLESVAEITQVEKDSGSSKGQVKLYGLVVSYLKPIALVVREWIKWGIVNRFYR